MKVICNCSGQWGDYCRRCGHGKAHIPKPAQIRGVIYDVACNTIWRTCRGPSQHSTTISHVVCVPTEVEEKECRWCKHWEELAPSYGLCGYSVPGDAGERVPWIDENHLAVRFPFDFGCKYWEARDD